MGQKGHALLGILDHGGEPQQGLLVVRIDLQHGLKITAGTGRLPGMRRLVTVLQECCDLLLRGM
jgi:hypothetical protein